MALMPRESAELVMSKAEHVQISQSAIDVLAKTLLEQTRTDIYDISRWKRDNPLHPQAMSEATVEWIFLIDSLNFSFWSTEDLTIEGQVGYWALCAAINRALAESIPITNPEFYSKLSLEDARHIFRTDSGLEIPLLPERVDILHQNGQILLSKFNGKFAECIRECGNSAVTLLRLIREHFRSFRDECLYDGQLVSFYKRAQILIADLWACFEGVGFGHFTDIGQLTMFADYRVPQVLHYFGVLRYSPTLTRQLLEHSLLQNGCQMEVELRAASIQAVELLRTQMQQLDPLNRNLPNAIQIDYYLWGYRRQNAIEIDSKSPFHRVRCIFY